MASTPDEIRRVTSREVELSRGIVVRITARDFLTMFLEGLFESPLLNAFQRIISNAPVLQEKPDLIFAMPPEERRAVIDGLRKFAIAVVDAPVIVESDDGNPNHVPVSLFTSTDLLVIWQQGNAMMQFKTPEVSLTEIQADRFRGSEPTTTGDDTQSRDSVRTSTAFVVSDAHADLTYR